MMITKQTLEDWANRLDKSKNASNKKSRIILSDLFSEIETHTSFKEEDAKRVSKKLPDYHFSSIIGNEQQNESIKDMIGPLLNFAHDFYSNKVKHRTADQYQQSTYPKDLEVILNETYDMKQQWDKDGFCTYSVAFFLYCQVCAEFFFCLHKPLTEGMQRHFEVVYGYLVNESTRLDEETKLIVMAFIYYWFENNDRINKENAKFYVSAVNMYAKCGVDIPMKNENSSIPFILQLFTMIELMTINAKEGVLFKSSDEYTSHMIAERHKNVCLEESKELRESIMAEQKLLQKMVNDCITIINNEHKALLEKYGEEELP